jgi:hypothetical protein
MTRCLLDLPAYQRYARNFHWNLNYTHSTTHRLSQHGINFGIFPDALILSSLRTYSSITIEFYRSVCTNEVLNKPNRNESVIANVKLKNPRGTEHTNKTLPIKSSDIYRYSLSYITLTHNSSYLSQVATYSHSA